jgi:hypothetical protein
MRSLALRELQRSLRTSRLDVCSHLQSLTTDAPTPDLDPADYWNCLRLAPSHVLRRFALDDLKLKQLVGALTVRQLKS